MNRQTIDRLNELSERFLGSRSKWRKIVEKGMPVPATEEVMVDETQEDGSVKQVAKRARLQHDRGGVLRTIRPTAEMLLAQLEGAEANRVAAELEKAKKELAEAIDDAAAGSSDLGAIRTE